MFLTALPKQWQNKRDVHVLAYQHPEGWADYRTDALDRTTYSRSDGRKDFSITEVQQTG